MHNSTDRVIQTTNFDATNSKAYAVRRGYWDDRYIKYFGSSTSLKSPEINRGYFVRTQSFKAITCSFIQTTGGQCQIINLGAGSDTLYFLLRDAQTLPLKFVEIDLPENVQHKITVIKRMKLLSSDVENSNEAGDLESHNASDNSTTSKGTQRQLFSPIDRYYLFAFDLRLPANDLVSFLCNPSKEIGVDPQLPTLILAECVLVYMPFRASTQLIGGLASHFPHAVFLHYEQVNMNDKFGSVMIDNFRARDCELPGLSSCQSLEHQEKRFLQNGWSKCKAWTINETYQLFPPSTRSRIERLEMLDDLEITYQLYNHYCILLAATDEGLFKGIDLEQALSSIH